MPRLIVIDRNGDERTLESSIGSSIMETIRGHGIDELMAICGGCLSCATCHVYADPSFIDELPAVTEDELTLLDGSDHRRETSRLSCQLFMTEKLDGLKVVIAPED